jgi:hypothetical protein
VPIKQREFARVVNGAVEDRERKRVLGGHFVNHFATYCEKELRRIGLRPESLDGGRSQKFAFHKKRTVLGGNYPKEVDVVLESNTSGPLLGISLKAPNSSILNNVNSRLEEMAGEAANLHSRFPMLVLGHVTTMPYVDQTERDVLLNSRGIPTTACRRIVNKLYGLSGRNDPTSTPGTFEEVAVAFVNYSKKAAVVCTSYPPSRSRAQRTIGLSTFFDRLLQRFRERNPLLFPEP